MMLVTDRTEADVLLGNEKGHYGYADLNRVEQAVAQLCTLAEKLDVHPTLAVKSDWGLPGAFDADTWPTQKQMLRYLDNVHALCDSLSLALLLPDTMENLTWRDANDIERALECADVRIRSVLEAYKYGGEIFAGEENCL